MANVETGSRKTLQVYEAKKLVPNEDHIVIRLVGPESKNFGDQPVVIYSRKEAQK